MGAALTGRLVIRFLGKLGWSKLRLWEILEIPSLNGNSVKTFIICSFFWRIHTLKSSEWQGPRGLPGTGCHVSGETLSARAFKAQEKKDFILGSVVDFSFDM